MKLFGGALDEDPDRTFGFSAVLSLNDKACRRSRDNLLRGHSVVNEAFLIILKWN